MLYKLEKKMFLRGGLTRKIIKNIILKREGGMMKTTTLRRIHKEAYNIEIGEYTYGWLGEMFDGPMTIGKYTSIGPEVKRLAVNHVLSGVTTHPCSFNPEVGWVKEDPRERSFLSIGNDVWIGTRATILPSVKYIGDGAVIGAGAVVTKDVEPYSIVAGVPARVIGQRFANKDTQQKLLNSRWWDIQEDTLKGMAQLFNDPESFIEELNNKNSER